MEMARERDALNHPKEGTMSRRKLITLLAALTLVAPLMFYGCSGDDGTNGVNGTNGLPGKDLTATATPESCTVCHGTAGDEHQASYDVLYQDNVIQVDNVAYQFVGNNDVVTFNMKSKKTGTALPFDCSKVQNLNIYFVQYDNNLNRFQFNPPLPPSLERLAIKGGVKVDNVVTGTLTSVGGLCTSTFPSQLDNVDLSTKNGVIVVYGFDEQVGSIPSPSRVKQVKYPYAGLLKTGTVDYVSAANVKGCEKCHTVPYLKHGNIYGRVNGDAATDMYTCKACHLDDGDGGHFVWQLLVDDPVRAGALWAQKPGDVESLMDNTEKAKYAYKTRLMNDVHMSHAMEFEYPQSMASCVTCHEGKLNKILTDNNFALETCRSCHPVTGSAQSQKPQPALKDILPASIHGSMNLGNNATNCNGCHKVGGIGPVFSAIHTGYDKVIYTDNGVKYSEIFKVTIDNATFVDNTNKLTFSFHATKNGGPAGLAVTDIKPTVLVGLYGWDSKDYIVGPHLQFNPPTDNTRNLEYVVGATHPRFTTVSAAGGSWTVTADLSAWASKIAGGSVKRAEIAVMPTLRGGAIADNAVLALDAPSKTFNLGTKLIEDFIPPPGVTPAPKPPAGHANDFFGNSIVKVTAGCNNCHDALATTFHSGDRGGNIVVCRLCHTTVSGASHLEMQSRSIDSYVHAIHAFQAFDIQSVHFDNAVQSMYYDLKIESHFPTFGLTDCEACHNKGKYNVPNQSKSLPGLHSASRDTLFGRNRKIDGVPSYVTGPASRACGSCHRVEWINEDDAVGLASFNSHTRTNGYLLASPPADVFTEINRIMFNWEDGIILSAPVIGP
jgi:OmcA/MtrC family decaheme c-type cytochrome